METNAGLPAHREQPSSAEQRYELAAFHSIMSSAPGEQGGRDSDTESFFGMLFIA
jgi:hypothetical protein